MAPIWTPLKLEFGLASRLAAGSATAASFPKSRRVKVIRSPLELHFPTLAIGRLDPLGGVLVVAELPLRVVPHQLAFVVYGGGAEHQPLGVWSGDAEIGASGRSALARTDPVARMRRVVRAGARAGRTLQGGVGQLIFRPTGSRQQADAFPASARAQVALRAHENAIVTAALPTAGSPSAAATRTGCASAAGSTGATGTAAGSLRATAGPREKPTLPSPRAHLRALARDLTRFFDRHARDGVGVAARVVIPVNRHRRHARTLGELILERQFIRERKRRQRVLLDALDADEELRIQLQRPVGRAEDMHAPIADQAAAEIVKATPIEGQVEAEVLLAATAAAPAGSAGPACRIEDPTCVDPAGSCGSAWRRSAAWRR